VLLPITSTGTLPTYLVVHPQASSDPLLSPDHSRSPPAYSLQRRARLSQHPLHTHNLIATLRSRGRRHGHDAGWFPLRRSRFCLVAELRFTVYFTYFVPNNSLPSSLTSTLGRPLPPPCPFRPGHPFGLASDLSSY
jgi:hypothetical protein